MRKLLLVLALLAPLGACTPEEALKFCNSANLTFNAVDAYDKYTQLSDKDRLDWDRRYVDAQTFCARHGITI